MTRGFGVLRTGRGSPKNRAQGTRAQDGGDASESYWQAQHDAAWIARLAKVRHVSPRVRILRVLGGGRFEVVFRGESGADYRGTVAGGRAVVAEAKSSDDHRLGRSILKPTQIADLDDAHALGALALLLVELTIDHRPRRFACPWPLAWTASGKGAGVGLEDLAAFEVRPGELYLRRFVP